jgi:tetratricopeptide (TPR) repeat protein
MEERAASKTPQDVPTSDRCGVDVDSSPSASPCLCAPDSPGWDASRATRWAALALVVLTIVAFSPALSGEFVNWDDQQLLLDNDQYRGWSADQLGWIFTTTYGGHYQPLTWLSYAIDWHLAGDDPLLFHVTNLALHVVAALAFFVVARQLLRRAGPIVCHGVASGGVTEHAILVGSFAAAAFFAVHPLRVESVAWITERRDVLSGALLLPAVACYLRATAQADRRRYLRWMAAAVVLYVFSLLAKAAGITLAFVLLVLDVYPVRRVRWRGRDAAPARAETEKDAPRIAADTATTTDAPELPSASWRQIAVEKLLFLVPAMAVAGIALSAQSAAGALWTYDLHPLGLRIAQAFYGLVFYVQKTLVPWPLLPLYEQPPGARAGDLEYVLSAALVVGVLVLLVLLRRRVPALLAAAACYLLFLAPVLGIAQSGPQLVADRYSYLSCLTWAVLIGGLFAKWWSRGAAAKGRHRRLLFVTGGGVLLALTLLTMQQSRIWRNSEQLWLHVLRYAPNTGLAHVNLSGVYIREGPAEEARKHAEMAIAILPGNRTAYLNAAQAAGEMEDHQAAEEFFRQAIDLHPEDAAARVGHALALFTLSRHDEALTAIEQVRELEPGVAWWHFVAGSMYQETGQWAAAERAFTEAHRLDPADPYAPLRLGLMRAAQGSYGAALDTWQRAAQTHPDFVAYKVERAWILATCPDDAVRDPAQAQRLIEAALAGTRHPNARTLETQAAVEAALDDYARALDIASRLLIDPPGRVPPAQEARLRDALEAYRSNQPYLDPGPQAPSPAPTP